MSSTEKQTQLSNQIMILGFQPTHLAQGSFLPKNQMLQNHFFFHSCDLAVLSKKESF